MGTASNTEESLTSPLPGGSVNGVPMRSGRRITFSPPQYGAGSPPKCGLSSRVLLNELKCFDKSSLSSCVTVITREDGESPARAQRRPHV